MKKNIVLTALTVLAIIASAIFVGDWMTYPVTVLMAVIIIGVIQHYRSRVIRITRWAKANPKKTQVAITVLQMALMVLGIIAGKNFREMGYEFSEITALVFTTIIIIGFASLPFLPKRNRVPIPQEVNKNRLSYLAIALSSFVMMAMVGNRIEDFYPGSSISRIVNSIDQAIFPDNNTTTQKEYTEWAPRQHGDYNLSMTGESTSQPAFASYVVNENETMLPGGGMEKNKAKVKAGMKASKLEKKKARLMNHFKKRMAAATGIGVGGILLIILLVITTCAGVCLMISGFGGGGAGAVVGGAALVVASVFGIVKLINRKKE